MDKNKGRIQLKLMHTLPVVLIIGIFGEVDRANFNWFNFLKRHYFVPMFK